MKLRMSSSIVCTLASASRNSITARSLARQRAQLRIVVRIGQAAHVEHEIGVQRNAVLVSERLEQQRQSRWSDSTNSLIQARSACGLSSLVSMWCDMLADVGEQLALALDAFGERQLADRSADGAAAFRKSA